MSVESVELPLCELRSVKSRGGKEAYAEVSVRMALGEAFEKAAAFLAFCQESGQPVKVTIARVQARFGEPTT